MTLSAEFQKCIGICIEHQFFFLGRIGECMFGAYDYIKNESQIILKEPFPMGTEFYLAGGEKVYLIDMEIIEPNGTFYMHTITKDNPLKKKG